MQPIFHNALSRTQGPASVFGGYVVGPLSQWVDGELDPQKQGKKREGLAQFAMLDSRGAAELRLSWHSAGERGPNRQDRAEGRITLGLLIDGRHSITLTHRQTGNAQYFPLVARGDFLAWPENDYSHTWLAETDSVLVTVRWAACKHD